ncbi:hypothetical protein CEXT_39401 [Caerostris extrusa]|uniref:Uncharacterized protein n=1 Tax=Caerostris extrusa TaxID=172846 RepID=A0AAV4UVI4_CAEEX|nr:hypothetical protein CEXT_39401 [Caerostris extrusa]
MIVANPCFRYDDRSSNISIGILSVVPSSIVRLFFMGVTIRTWGVDLNRALPLHWCHSPTDACLLAADLNDSAPGRMTSALIMRKSIRIHMNNNKPSLFIPPLKQTDVSPQTPRNSRNGLYFHSIHNSRTRHHNIHPESIRRKEKSCRFFMRIPPRNLEMCKSGGGGGQYLALLNRVIKPRKCEYPPPRPEDEEEEKGTDKSVESHAFSCRIPPYYSICCGRSESEIGRADQCAINHDHLSRRDALNLSSVGRRSSAS